MARITVAGMEREETMTSRQLEREREREIKEAGVDLYREQKMYDINSKRLAWMLEEMERNCKLRQRQTETERDSDRDTQ